MSFLTPVWNYVDALVHPSVQGDVLSTARHRLFIAPRVLGSRGNEERLARDEVLTDGPYGDARALGDLRCGGRDVSLLDEVDERGDDGLARPNRALAPAVPFLHGSTRRKHSMRLLSDHGVTVSVPCIVW